MGKLKLLSQQERLSAIARILMDVDTRCMACDGPVTPTRQEIHDDELRRIYLLATGDKRAIRRR